MPYRPHIAGAGRPGELPHTFRLGGISCLAGDVIGDYSFAAPLKVGDRLILADMAFTPLSRTHLQWCRVAVDLFLQPGRRLADPVEKIRYSDYRSRLA